MKNLKRIALISLTLVTLASTAFAANYGGTRDRLVFVGSSNAGDRHELNYYLDRGAQIISFVPIARNNSQNIACYVHVRYPANVPKYQDRNKK